MKDLDLMKSSSLKYFPREIYKRQEKDVEIEGAIHLLITTAVKWRGVSHHLLGTSFPPNFEMAGSPALSYRIEKTQQEMSCQIRPSPRYVAGKHGC